MRFLQPLDQFCEWLVKASWQAAVLILLVLLVQRVLGKRLAPAWRYNLWLVVVVRLALPISPESSWSIFNYSGLNNEVVKIGQKLFGPGPDQRANTADFSQSRQGLAEIVSIPFSSVIDLAYPVVSSKGEDAQFSGVGGIRWAWLKVDRLKLFAVFWLTGFLYFGWRLIRNYRSLRRHLKALEPIRDPEVLKVWDQAREIMGCKARVVLVESERVHSPALCGFFQFYLFLPPRMIQHFSEHELRLVFLHELAHIKRGDVQINWLVTFFQLLHWFNPVLWWGFKCMRTDREVAADALVLVNSSGRERKAYGRTIIRLLEGFAPTPSSSGFVSLLEDDEQFRHRIQMMADFRNVASSWSLLGCSLLLLLGLVGLTDRPSRPESVAAIAKDVEPPAASLVTSDQVTMGIVSLNTDNHPIPAPKTGGSKALEPAEDSKDASTTDDKSPAPDESNVTQEVDESRTVLKVEDLMEFLKPFGDWIEHPEWGVCWTPTAAGKNHLWRPYRDFGRWIRTDKGLYWKSDYVWGWVAFHYGRWALDEKRGTWYWVPDSKWGPAWVIWRETTHYYGWAPIPPDWKRDSRQNGGANDLSPVSPVYGLLDDKRFVFVPRQKLFDSGLEKYDLPTYWIQRLIAQSGAAYLTSLDSDDFPEFANVETESGDFTKIPASFQMRIRDFASGDSEYPRSEWIDFEREEIYVFRPVLNYPSNQGWYLADIRQPKVVESPAVESASKVLLAPGNPKVGQTEGKGDDPAANPVSMTPSAPYAHSIRETVSSLPIKP